MKWLKQKWKKLLLWLGIGITTASSVYVGGAAIDEQINPYTDRGTHYELKVDTTLPGEGESWAELYKASPSIQLKKWDGQAVLGIEYLPVSSTGERQLLTDRVEWKGGSEEVHAHPSDKGIEIDIVLNGKPDKQIFDFQLSGWENFHFIHEESLKKEWESGELSLDLAVSCTDTECLGEDGRVVTERPENVVNSYVVRSKTKRDYREGDINYGTGNAFHILRPKMRDTQGKEFWGILSYNEGILSVKIPDEVYNDPTVDWSRFVIDPVFGYPALGSRNSTTGPKCVKTTATTESGTITNISFYARSESGTDPFGTAIYSTSSGDPGTKLAEDSGNVDIGAETWATTTVSYAFSASTVYHLCAWGSDALGWSYWFTGSSDGEFVDASGSPTFESWPDPWGSVSNFNQVISIYATYTTGGGGATYRTIDFLPPW